MMAKVTVEVDAVVAKKLSEFGQWLSKEARVQRKTVRILEVMGEEESDAVKVEERKKFIAARNEEAVIMDKTSAFLDAVWEAFMSTEEGRDAAAALKPEPVPEPVATGY
jgi:hypothetical protein